MTAAAMTIAALMAVLGTVCILHGSRQQNSFQPHVDPGGHYERASRAKLWRDRGWILLGMAFALAIMAFTLFRAGLG